MKAQYVLRRLLFQAVVTAAIMIVSSSINPGSQLDTPDHGGGGPKNIRLARAPSYETNGTTGGGGPKGVLFAGAEGNRGGETNGGDGVPWPQSGGNLLNA